MVMGASSHMRTPPMPVSVSSCGFKPHSYQTNRLRQCGRLRRKPAFTPILPSLQMTCAFERQYWCLIILQLL